MKSHVRRFGYVLALATSFVATACGRAFAPSGPAPRLAEGVSAHAGTPFTISGGNAVSLLVDGPRIFDEVEATIGRARKSVQLHMFQLGGDTGLRVVRALAAKQAAGVQVQVLLDPNRGGAGSVKAQALRCTQALDQAGIAWRDFDLGTMPKGPTWLSSLGMLDHAKLLVIDGETAIMGGMNFYDDGAPNHDYMLRIEGPAATELGETMNQDWRLSGPAAGVVPLTPANSRGDATLTLAETSPRARNIRALLTERFAAARKKIWVEALFLDDDRVIDALVKAHQRQVDVRVILDPIDWGNHVPELDKLPFNGIPNWSAVRRLVAAGVNVNWFVPDRPKRNLHAKIAMVDDRWVLTGSANYTYRSLDRNRELAVEAEAPEVAQAFAEVFTADLAAATRITELSAFQKRLAALFDRIKKGIYDPGKDLPAPGPSDAPVAPPTL